MKIVPELSGILRLLEDWKIVLIWPTVSIGEKNSFKTSSEIGDDTSTNIVGWISILSFWRYGGGGPTYLDTWPIETVSRKESAVVSGDTLSGGENYMYGGVTENYWLLTSGAAIHVDEDVPLFISMMTPKYNIRH